MRKKIAVLVVEDSQVAQMLLVHILNSDARLNVIGAVNSGEQALEFIQRKKPDVIIMDIHMGGMDGYSTTRKIMETSPVPIVICTGSLSSSEVAADFQALEAGAVALIAKPAGVGHPNHEATASKLIETVTLMSEVKVIKRWPRARASNPHPERSTIADTRKSRHRLKVVAIGASTGGPPALHTILAALPRDFPLPVLIVQHIAAGFLVGLAEWLSASAHFPVQIAAHGEIALPGRAYLAPDNHHMGIDHHGRIVLGRQEPENGVRPSVSHLFRSVAAACGANAVGVLLTGMGRDGADELKRLREAGSVTIAQDMESSVVHGMPGEAIRLGAALHVLAPDKIAGALITLAENSRERRTQDEDN